MQTQYKKPQKFSEANNNLQKPPQQEKEFQEASLCWLCKGSIQGIISVEENFSELIVEGLKVRRLHM